VKNRLNPKTYKNIRKLECLEFASFWKKTSNAGHCSITISDLTIRDVTKFSASFPPTSVSEKKLFAKHNLNLITQSDVECRKSVEILGSIPVVSLINILRAAFAVYILSTKNIHSQTVIIIKLFKALSKEKVVHKMLMKLTPDCRSHALDL